MKGLPAGQAEELLRINQLDVSYALARSGFGHAPRRTAVHDVSISIRPGQVVALVGESGCGKTSLARAVLQLAPVSRGEIVFRGQAVHAMDKNQRRHMRRQIQFVFQDPLASLSPRRSLWQTLLEPLKLYRNCPPSAYRSRIIEVLEQVGLGPDCLESYPHELSGGQRQRVALARALLAGPALIVADEPMSSLDVSVQARIITLMRQLSDELGIAFLLISHDLAVVQQLADLIAVMYLGRVVEFGEAGEVLARPAHPYTQALINAVAMLDATAGPNDPGLPGEPPSALTPPPGCVFHTRCRHAMEVCRATIPGKSAAPQAPGEYPHQVWCHLWS